MTVGGALNQGKERLFYAEVDTPMLDATLLLSEALETSKERLLASLPDPLDPDCWRRYCGLLDLRCAGLPVSYIRRKKEFFSLEFYVDRRVMVPRPDTEVLVEEALAILERNPHMRRVHDACTGSGCVAITVKHSRPDLTVSGSEISREALQVAALNARRLVPQARLRLFRSDLLSRVPGRYDLITANPPYLTDLEVEKMEKVGWPEPALALQGGPEGLDLLRRLIAQAQRKLRDRGYLLLEAAPIQMAALQRELADRGYQDITVVQDLAGRERMIRARR
ncbi:MAG: peptide chain release factor N(5)-glutamine methyltransferase [Spirochaetaceae bacterium]|nr:MAG: peptide chain release factor N(5)-glutamine methyltransferase [Spirochaetaceae bacterium]